MIVRVYFECLKRFNESNRRLLNPVFIPMINTPFGLLDEPG